MMTAADLPLAHVATAAAGQAHSTQQLADDLNTATRAGDLAGALRVVRDLSKQDAQHVALAAGHTVIRVQDRAFLAHLQASISGACPAGFGHTVIHIFCR